MADYTLTGDITTTVTPAATLSASIRAALAQRLPWLMNAVDQTRRLIRVFGP